MTVSQGLLVKNQNETADRERKYREKLAVELVVARVVETETAVSGGCLVTWDKANPHQITPAINIDRQRFIALSKEQCDCETLKPGITGYLTQIGKTDQSQTGLAGTSRQEYRWKFIEVRGPEWIYCQGWHVDRIFEEKTKNKK